MNKNATGILILSLLFFCSCSGQGFKQNMQLPPAGNSLTGLVDSIVISKMHAYDIPGLAIGLVFKDSIIYSKGYGQKSIELPDPVTAGTNFHTASISKLFTAQAIMILVNKGAISLEDRLVDIVPELNVRDKRVKKITIESLLNHTSGLPDISNYHWENNHQDKASLRNYILGLKLKVRSEPMTEYAYSNLGYNLLGYVIEKVSGLAFEEYLREMILEPSGMAGSDFRYFKIPDSIRSSPHSRNRLTKRVYVRKTYPYTREQAPGSTLNSSALDLSRWMISFLNDLDSKDLEKVYSHMLKSSFESYPYIGLGFQLGELASQPTAGHFGGDRGYRSYLLMIPEHKMGLVLLANCDYNEDFRQEILHPIGERMLALHANSNHEN